MKKRFTLFFAVLFAVCAQAQVLWTIPNVQFEQGDTVEAKFYVHGFNSIAAFQYAMRYDTAFLERIGVEFTGTMPNFGIANFSFHAPGYNLLHGEIRTFKTNITGITVEDGSHTHTIKFVAKQAGNLASLFWFWPDKQYFNAIAYSNPPLTPVALEVAYTETGETTSAAEKENGFAVAVYPNPIGSDGKANVFVNLPQPGEVRINAVDSAGYIVFGGWYRHGGGTESFDIDIPFSGVHYLQVTVGNETIIKTVVRQ